MCTILTNSTCTSNHHTTTLVSPSMARIQGQTQQRRYRAQHLHHQHLIMSSRSKFYKSSVKGYGGLMRSRIESPSKAPQTITHNHLTINEVGSRSETSTSTPRVLLVYLQLLFNASLVALSMHFVLSFFRIMRKDVDCQLEVQRKQLQQEIDICTNEYHSNHCYPLAERTKFMEQHCIDWERCMNRQLSKSKIWAETFAEVMNGFMDAISLRTMVKKFLSICDPFLSLVHIQLQN